MFKNRLFLFNILTKSTKNITMRIEKSMEDKIMDEKILNEEYNPDIVTLSDDDGKEYTFEILDAVESDTGRYLALLPVFEDAQKLLDDSGELVIVKVQEENGEEFFAEIEDDEEYEMIADAFVDRLQDYFEIDNK